MRPYPLAQLGSLVVAVALLNAAGCTRQPSVSANLTATGTAGPIRLLDVDGNPFDLWQANPARPVVAVFTRSDCPVSNRYAPDIRQLYERFQPKGVDFYLVYVDPREQPDAIRAHLAEYGYPCPALRDPEHSLVAHTGVTVTPEAVVFAADQTVAYRGRIDDRYAEVGKPRAEPTTHELADAIEATLAGRPVAEPVTKAVGCYIEDLK